MYINDLIETHCHILPGLDDGAKDLNTSLKMIAKLQAQGCKKIISTSHYYSDSIALDDFLAKREVSYKLLKENLPEGSPEIKLGAEVFISRYLFNEKNVIPDAAVEGTNIIYIEHQFSEEFSNKAIERLESLMFDYNLTPILVHIERYKALMEDPSLLDELINAGCITQANIGAFSDSPRSVRKKLLKYVESGRIQLIGSDCHNMDSRSPNYEDGCKVITEKLGKEYLDKLVDNANRIFG